VADFAQREIEVVNRLGLHARPAAMIVKAAGSFAAEVFLIKDDVRINAKSIMGVMMLAAECGSTLLIEAQGSDAEAAVTAVAEVFAAKFGED
jgi:phosphocarrier protein